MLRARTGNPDPLMVQISNENKELTEAIAGRGRNQRRVEKSCAPTKRRPGAGPMPNYSAQDGKANAELLLEWEAELNWIRSLQRNTKEDIALATKQRSVALHAVEDEMAGVRQQITKLEGDLELLTERGIEIKVDALLVSIVSAAHHCSSLFVLSLCSPTFY